MYVVRIMQEQTLETSDATIGIECKVEKHNNSQNRIRFKNSFANIGENVAILTLSEHSNYLQLINDADKYIAKINQLQDEIDNADIKALKKQLAVYEKQVDKLSKSNNTYKQWNDEFKAKNQELQDKIDKYKQTIAELKEHNDAIAKQLEDAIDESEHQSLQDEVATLQEKLATSENKKEYWQNAYNNLVDSSDELTFRNDELIAENKDLKNKFDEINNANKLLNEHAIGLKTTFDKIIEDKTTDAKNTEKELKENIKNKQSHIDEITDKYQSLLPSKDNIPQKQHYDEIIALKDEIKAKEIEIDKLNGEIETKLATQKSELEIAHADEVNQIKIDNTEKNAQMLVAYNQELNKLKLEYNNLANEYNTLLNGVDSLTRINTLVNGKHNEIKKDKEQVPLLEIISEQLPPSDENILEFVPKDEKND